MEYKFIHPNKDYTIPAVCGIYVTNTGIYPEYECTLVNDLLVTSERVERHYFYFANLSEFKTWVKSNLIKTTRDTDLVGSYGLYVGYWISIHQTKYGIFEYHKGEFMDSVIYWKTNKRITSLGNPDLWLI